MTPIPSLTQLPTGMTTFGEKLRYLRDEKEMTQDDLVKTILKKHPGAGISRDMVAGWERNRHYPFIPTVIMLCDFFKVTTDEMLRDKISIRTIVKNRQKQPEKVPK